MGYVQGDRTSHDQMVERFAMALDSNPVFASVTPGDRIDVDGRRWELDLTAYSVTSATTPAEPESDRSARRDPWLTYRQGHSDQNISTIVLVEFKSGTGRGSRTTALEQLRRGREYFGADRRIHRVFSYLVTPGSWELADRLLKPPHDTLSPVEAKLYDAFIHAAFASMKTWSKRAA